MLELENFLTKFSTHEEEFCIVILNKKLFRIGHGDPDSQLDKRAYYCLIGHAYQNHLIEKVTANVDPGFKYTFFKNGGPKNMQMTEEL
jgi:hypothetical protein